MKSMTGYAAAAGRRGGVELTVEVRSVNQRHLDVKVLAPREYGALEADLRREVGRWVARGRVDLVIARAPAPESRAVTVNKKAAAAYVAAWRELQRAFKLDGEVGLSLLQGRSEIFQTAGADIDVAAEGKTVEALVAKALKAHDRERNREGAHLARDIKEQARALASVARDVRERVEGMAPRLAERLEQKLAALLDGRGLEPARIAQEAAVLADRADVSEEIVRLASHLEALDALIGEKAPVGKRIEFLLQEVNRELNTIGSKASDLEVTRAVLDGKAAVEKIREQVQNVE